MKAAIDGKKPAPAVALRKGGINPPPGPDFVRPAPPPPFKPGAKQVDEKEAKALREENGRTQENDFRLAEFYAAG